MTVGDYAKIFLIELNSGDMTASHVSKANKASKEGDIGAK